MNEQSELSTSRSPERWPLPIFDRIQDRVRVGIIVWVALWFGTTVTLMGLKRDNWAMPLMLVGVVGLLALTRATKFLQARLLGKAQRSQDQLCSQRGYYLTTENLRCPECGGVYTLADTRSAWEVAREVARRA